MEKKVKKLIPRTELADYLQQLSEQLRTGALESEGRQWSTPEEIFAEITLKEKKGYIKAKIEWAWPTEGEYEPEEKAKLTKYRDSFKGVKKRLTAAFKQVRQAAEAGRFPEEQALTELAETSRAFAQMLDQDWGEAMGTYLDHLENLQRAVAAKDLEAMRHEVRDLGTCMVGCHREFKYSPEKGTEGAK